MCPHCPVGPLQLSAELCPAPSHASHPPAGASQAAEGEQETQIQSAQVGAEILRACFLLVKTFVGKPIGKLAYTILQRTGLVTMSIFYNSQI